MISSHSTSSHSKRKSSHPSWTTDEDAALKHSIEANTVEGKKDWSTIIKDMKARGYPERGKGAYQRRGSEYKIGKHKGMGASVHTKKEKKKAIKVEKVKEKRENGQAKNGKKDQHSRHEREVAEGEEGALKSGEEDEGPANRKARVRGIELLNANYKALVEATTALLEAGGDDKEDN